MSAEKKIEPPPTFTLSAALLHQGYRLRPEEAADTAFLMTLYASTRASELAAIPWSEEQKSAFCAQQFDAQRSYYRATIAACRFDVITYQGEPLGRLYLEETAARLHVVDIALMPVVRGKGLGTAILETLQRFGEASGRPVSIMVEKFNPALHLYRRLGFAETADHDVYLEMEWRAL